MPSPDAQMSWATIGDEFVYIDPDASTDDTLVGYAYTVFGEVVPDGQAVPLTMWTCDVPFTADFTESQFHEQTFDIPCTKAVESVSFANADNGLVSVSPLGLVLDAQTGLLPAADDSEDYSWAADPVNIRSIVIKISNEESYTVLDDTANLYNALSLCCFDTNICLAFNRLVDPQAVEAIEVTATDVEAINEQYGGDGAWPGSDDWPTCTVTYKRS